MRPTVHGLELDPQTRCAHWRSPLDIIAIRMRCCGRYYACRACHDALEAHAAEVWPTAEWDAPAVLCGACGHELSVGGYLACGSRCPACGADFNPGCHSHRHLYFAEPAPSAAELIEAAPVAAAPGLSIPTLDLGGGRGLDPAALARACREWGLFHVTGHGVPEATIAAAREASRRFFALPRPAKLALSRSRESPWGYNDRELTKTRRDRKQIFDIACGGGADDDAAPFQGETPWPQRPAEFRGAMEAFAAACERLAFDLLGSLADSLGVERARLAGLYRPGHSSFLRLNYYPVRDALEPELGPSDLGIHHHTDAGALTVLLQDRVSGLQVYRDGRWHEAAPVEGALTVNIGDLAQVWSNDLYPAPIHRVRAMTRQDRYTAAFFFNPAYAAAIAPLAAAEPAYRPFRWGEFRAGRAEGDFANYGTEVQISDYRLAPGGG